MSKQPTTVIIGAGPAGLGAAWRLTELGMTDFVILEKESHVGGLAASFTDENGFTWDIGGHVTHSHYPYFDRVFAEVMEGEYVTHRRKSWVYVRNRYIPYPFQNNIHRLAAVDRDWCLRGLQEARRQHADPKDFREWLIATYGEGIADLFLIPYNRKVWAYPLEDMSDTWVSDRVPPVDIGKIEAAIRTNTDDADWGPNLVFHYPKKGGTGDIWRRVSHRFRDALRLNTEVTRIDADQKTVMLSGGETLPYSHVFSSMPLTHLCRQVTGVVLPDITTRLHASAVTVTGIGIPGDPPAALRDASWIYYPQNDIPFFRATVLSNYSPHNAPPGTWSLMMETSSTDMLPLPKGNLTNAIIRAARELRLIPESAPTVDRWSTTVALGYPTPTLDRDRVIDPVISVLERAGITSRGRFGLWKYEVSNQDHTFMQGVDWADTVRAKD